MSYIIAFLSGYVFLMYTFAFVFILLHPMFEDSRAKVGYTVFPALLLALLNIIQLLGVR